MTRRCRCMGGAHGPDCPALDVIDEGPDPRDVAVLSDRDTNPENVMPRGEA